MNKAWSISFWVLWALLAASWILALAGLASVQNNCYSDPGAALSDVTGVHGGSHD
ncbi:hypothetical protein MNEG_2758 [Monoraphidium neglectum]|uniref:Uncharacterized protein n=1 Tax=Monoraphidium neglectum TaxID=145388 RepID=A0A0D2LEW2_9CHLO|nr:hypothetical protein MNEG_2758 [Monoraphidium neglectum]KIZ05204.1 hypothetical protein MNEG_2758 [Monoraphidium neglectum]|eukprot:XP_013904223.1 hypothetical protein MNEG_2758 [Monoraphidium neglectum]